MTGLTQLLDPARYGRIERTALLVGCRPERA
jgi:hypothetical protein